MATSPPRACRLRSARTSITSKRKPMIDTRGYAADSAPREPPPYPPTPPPAPARFDRRDPGPKDIQIEILYCGVCHSDLHTVRSEWKDSVYPVVPGHEIVGRVTATGNRVGRFNIGDTVGVGVLVDSC